MAIDPETGAETPPSGIDWQERFGLLWDTRERVDREGVRWISSGAFGGGYCKIGRRLKDERSALLVRFAFGGGATVGARLGFAAGPKLTEALAATGEQSAGVSISLDYFDTIVQKRRIGAILRELTRLVEIAEAWELEAPVEQAAKE
jgi:hypothetical protein